MDKQLDARFERVEKALSTLIDSISKYNPSTTLANDLVAADKELNRGLEELQTHQNNHLRILSLHEGIASLDAQIKSTLVALANSRKDITSTPVTVFPDGPNYEIRYDELLSYARRISKTTLPPAGVTNGVDMEAGAGTADSTPPGAATPAPVTPVVATPSAAAPGGAGSAGGAGTTAVGTPAPQTNGGGLATPTAMQQSSQQQQHGVDVGDLAATQGTGTSGTAILPQEIGSYLDPHSGTYFFPWPQDDKVRNGALFANQQAAERGVDLRTWDPVAEEQARAAAEADRLRREEEQRQRAAEQERERLAEMQARRQQEIQQLQETRSDSVFAPETGELTTSARREKPPEPARFQFLGGFDDDDDDDD